MKCLAEEPVTIQDIFCHLIQNLASSIMRWNIICRSTTGLSCWCKSNNILPLSMGWCWQASDRMNWKEFSSVCSHGISSHQEYLYPLSSILLIVSISDEIPPPLRFPLLLCFSAICIYQYSLKIVYSISMKIHVSPYFRWMDQYLHESGESPHQNLCLWELEFSEVLPWLSLRNSIKYWWWSDCYWSFCHDFLRK